eukprot:5079555-Prymnesium_polylepis.1
MVSREDEERASSGITGIKITSVTERLPGAFTRPWRTHTVMSLRDWFHSKRPAASCTTAPKAARRE